MTAAEKNTAIQSIKDIQEQIESFEAEWAKANKTQSLKTLERIDRRIELLLSMRRGMEMVLTDLGIEFDRKEVVLTDTHGETTYHTMWYLI